MNDTTNAPPDVPAAHAPRDSRDVAIVQWGDREFLLVGTAHVSQESADLARQMIVSENPDAVCIELDERRYAALRSEQKFESLDLREVLRRKQLSTLIFNLILASYQRQLGLQLGVQPGAELLAAARVAEEHGAPVVLCDRDVRTTLKRAWSSLSLWRKLQLISAMLASLLEKPEISEEELRELRQQDVVTKLMDELGAEFPSLKRVLIDERDLYLAEKIRRSDGRRVVAVMGAGHVPGVRRTLESGASVDLPALDEVPETSAISRWLNWGVPAAIIAATAVIGIRQGADEALDNALFWILATGVPAMIGSAAALAHPLTIVSAFLAAPITTLHPLIAAGYVTAIVQTYLRPPFVSELHDVMTDVRIPSKWWSNRLLRIFLVFFLTNLGGSLGFLVGAAEIFSNLAG